MERVSSKKRFCIQPYIVFAFSALIFSLIIVFILTPPISYAGSFSTSTYSVRTVNIKIASDADFRTRLKWELDIGSLMHECSRVFEKRFGIKLNIEKYEYWEPQNEVEFIELSLIDLRKKVPSDECDLVLGIVSPDRVADSKCGVSSYCNGYILLKHQILEKKMEYYLLHELCHIFGAIDLYQPGSLMGVVELGREFDEFTSELISLNKNRTFVQGTFPLPVSKLDDAISICLDREKLDLKEPELKSLLVNLYLVKGDYEAVIANCREELTRNPRQAHFLSFLGTAFRKRGEIDNAIVVLKKALELQNYNPEIYFNLGMCFMEKGKLDLSIQAFHSATVLHPDNSIYRFDLGVALSQRGDTERAIDEFKETIQLKPDNYQAHNNLARLYFGKGMVDEGISELKYALEINPKDAFACSNLAWAYLQKDMKKEAFAFCQLAIDLDSLLPQPYNFMGVLYHNQGKRNAAEKKYKKAIELKPDYLEAHYNLANLYFESGFYSRSIRHFKKVLKIDASSAPALVNIALAYYQKGKYDLAYQFLIQAENNGYEALPKLKEDVLRKVGRR